MIGCYVSKNMMDDESGDKRWISVKYFPAFVLFVKRREVILSLLFLLQHIFQMLCDVYVNIIIITIIIICAAFILCVCTSTCWQQLHYRCPAASHQHFLRHVSDQ